MNKIKLEYIDKNEALRWLGVNDVPDEKLAKLMDECEKKLLEAVNGRFVYRVFDITLNDGEKITLDGCTLTLTGNDVCKHLKGCEKAVLLCATVGTETDRLIRFEQAADMASAVVTDAMAGCAVEQICDIAEKAIAEAMPEMFMTWRFSPGYGDLPIESQRGFLETLNAQRTVGVSANENSILTPRKSVTAVIGLSLKEIEKKRAGCTICRLKDSCTFRQKGLRCYE